LLWLGIVGANLALVRETRVQKTAVEPVAQLHSDG